MAGVLQNKFLETIIGLSQELEATFILANAKVESYPIIYCSEDFSEETGYPRYEVTRYDVYFEFLRGRQTSSEKINIYEQAIANVEKMQVEMILYTKRQKNWYLISLFPVRNEMDNKIEFFLVLFNNISHLRSPIHDSPRRVWRRAVKKVLNKPSMEKILEDLGKCKANNRKNLDMNTIRTRSANMFVPAYGGEIFELAGFIIKHFSTPKVIWDTLIVLLIIYNTIMMPYLMVFDVHDEIVVGLDAFIDALFIVDIIMNFFTTYIDQKGDVVSLPKKIRNHYFRGFFAIDVVACLPYFLYFVIIKILKQDPKRQVKGVIIIKCLRLLRITKVHPKMGTYMQMSWVILATWLSAFFLFSHWLACIWYAIALYIDHPYHEKHGWLSVYADLINMPYKFDNNSNIIAESGPSNGELYISSLYYTLSSLTTCGFGNIAPNTVCEKVFGCITMLTGCVLYAFIFGQVTNIIAQMQKNSNEYKDKLDDIHRFNVIYKVPQKVAKRLEHYFRSTWAVTKGTDEEQILRICPRDLQSDLCLHIHTQIFKKNRGFHKLSMTALRLISRYLCTIRTAPGDKVVFAGEYVDEIYFVATGALEVKQGDDVMGLIGPGDAFGQRLGFSEEFGKSLFDVEATTFGSIHCISRDHLKEALALFPEEYEKIRYSLVLSIDITRRIKLSKKSNASIGLKEHEISVTDDTGSVSIDLPKENIITPNIIKLNNNDRTEVEYPQYHTEIRNEDLVLSRVDELKAELRRETERMNAKMGLVEAQMRLVLKVLRKQNRIGSDPEIGLQLNELLVVDQGLGSSRDSSASYISSNNSSNISSSNVNVSGVARNSLTVDPLDPNPNLWRIADANGWKSASTNMMTKKRKTKKKVNDSLTKWALDHPVDDGTNTQA